MTEMDRALGAVNRAVRIIQKMKVLGDYTEEEVRSARACLFYAIGALDTYILVPPGEYRKVKPY